MKREREAPRRRSETFPTGAAGDGGDGDGGRGGGGEGEQEGGRTTELTEGARSIRMTSGW